MFGVRPVSFSITETPNVFNFDGMYFEDKNYELIARLAGGAHKLTLCSHCADAGYLNPGHWTATTAHQWNGQEVSESVTLVCEKHAQDEAENFFAIGK